MIHLVPRAFLLGCVSLLWAFPVSAQECPVCPPLVAVPGGVLERADGTRGEVAPFHLAQSEVTFDQWQACVEDGACRDDVSDRGWGRGDRPVINVTFHDAQDYVAWLREKTGQPWRLPREDEWEWAARGGTETLWWWGDQAEGGYANCRGCGTPWSGLETAPVLALPANPYGLYGMGGNVWEWVADCWSPQRSAPPEDQDCTRRVNKGGAWYHVASQSRPEARTGMLEGVWSYTIGFRVALTPRPDPVPDPE